MGISSAQLTSSALNNRVAVSYPLEKGTLANVTAHVPDLSIRPEFIWGQIAITTDGEQPENVAGILAQGYIGSGHAISWSGAIKLSPGMRLALLTWGRTATTVILKAITNEYA